jgi:hypothetical protein
LRTKKTAKRGPSSLLRKPRAREYLSKVDNIRLEKPFDVAYLKKIVSDHVARAKGTKDALR